MVTSILEKNNRWSYSHVQYLDKYLTWGFLGKQWTTFHKKLQLRYLTGFWMSFWVLYWVAPSHSSCTPSPIFYRKLFGVMILALSIFTTFLFCSKVHFLRYLITRYMYNILSISSEKYSWANVSSDYINCFKKLPKISKNMDSKMSCKVQSDTQISL